jgi:5'-3' exonuclease
MIEYEADDALAAAARICSSDKRVEQVVICTPDKDLAQCVSNDRVVQLDRRRKQILNEEGIIRKFGVTPESIPDYLALVGDSADGFPGLSGWGRISAAKVLRKFRHLEEIPSRIEDWHVDVNNAGGLVASLKTNWEQALLFRRLATLVTEDPVQFEMNELHWTEPAKTFEETCTELEAPELLERVKELVRKRNPAS